MNKFIKVRNDLIEDKRLNDTDKYLYMIVISYMDNTSTCYFKRETIEKRTGMSQATISRSITKLEKLGYLKVKKQYFKKKRTNNSYELPYFINSHYTMMDLNILNNEELEASDILFYIKLKKFVFVQSKKYKGTKNDLQKLLNVDRKKFFNSIKKLISCNILKEDKTQEGKYVLEMTYELSKNSEKTNEGPKEKIKNIIVGEYTAWGDLDVKINKNGYETFEDWCKETRNIC